MVLTSARFFAVSALVAVIALQPACKPKSNAPPLDKAEAAAAALPPARVDLPAPIKLEGTLPPETHADGKMRIDGLLSRREKYVGQKIVVRGFLVEKYEPPKDAKRFMHNHGYLADTQAGGEKKLLLTGLRDKLRDVLVVGQEYIITGEFAQRTDDGFVSSVGLLIFESAEGIEIDDKGVVKVVAPPK